MKRTLRLTRETLSELSTDELSYVAAGAAPATPSCPGGPTDICRTYPLLDCVLMGYTLLCDGTPTGEC